MHSNSAAASNLSDPASRTSALHAPPGAIELRDHVFLAGRHPFTHERQNAMNLVSIRLIANDMRGMVGFYETVTGLAATWYTQDFVELATPSAVLAIASKGTMHRFGAGAAHPADNRTAILEFRVADVDADYARLCQTVSDFVQAPTTQPWGNRSLLFRDPEGNLINFFTPVNAAAIKQLGSPVLDPGSVL